MSDWVQGIDVSRYQGAILQPQWEALYAAGQRVAVVGSAHPSPNPHAEGNLARAEAAGFILATYAVVWPGLPSGTTIQVAKQMCGRFWDNLSFVGIDCETDGITEAQIYGMEQAILAEGLRPIMYTGQWWWQGHFGDSQAFKHLPLWTANYRTPPNSDAVPLYGGWGREQLIGHQWAGTVSLAGVTVDRNNFLRDFIGVIMPTPTPTDSQRLLACQIWAEAIQLISKHQSLSEELKLKLRFLAS